VANLLGDPVESRTIACLLELRTVENATEIRCFMVAENSIDSRAEIIGSGLLGTQISVGMKDVV
jgi:hypothetical protein